MFIAVLQQSFCPIGNGGRWVENLINVISPLVRKIARVTKIIGTGRIQSNIIRIHQSLWITFWHQAVIMLPAKNTVTELMKDQSFQLYFILPAIRYSYRNDFLHIIYRRDRI